MSNDNLSKELEYQVRCAMLDGLTRDEAIAQAGWNNPRYDTDRQRVAELNDYVDHQFDVAEGVLTCGKCNSSRVLSYSKQCRSADEPTTTSAQCMKCKHKWTENH